MNREEVAIMEFLAAIMFVGFCKCFKSFCDGKKEFHREVGWRIGQLEEYYSAKKGCVLALAMGITREHWDKRIFEIGIEELNDPERLLKKLLVIADDEKQQVILNLLAAVKDLKECFEFLPVNPKEILDWEENAKECANNLRRVVARHRNLCLNFEPS